VGVSHSSTRAQDLVFTASVTCISRVLILRNRLLGRMRKLPPDNIHSAQISHHSIPSGKYLLDAVFVRPPEEPARAALLICHGIAENVDDWTGVQELLALHGVASLAFDYCGYGKSTGPIAWSQCERDAVAAFEFLRALAPAQRISILGFSMGSGIAAAILNRIDVDCLILCSAFTSFRDAACVLGLPSVLSPVLPPIWSGKESLGLCSLPVLIVHCERDTAFPVRMASELASWCGANAELVVVPDQRHNEPFFKPQMSYWSHVLSRLAGPARAHQHQRALSEG
jgi:alpha-beta hydrolase superfamily lysophospholipase